MANASKLKLPKGVQTFRRIRVGGYYYVDKTAHALRLAEDGDTHYFLSRPRRFGKSLFLDTLKELYEGDKALFHGLAIHDRWDWSARHPVMRLSYAGGNFAEQGLVRRHTLGMLDDIGRRAGIEPRGDTVGLRLRHLLTELHRQAGHRAVILVDEYDKPILNALDDRQVAEDNRGYLRGLFGTIKDCDAHIEMSFVTGVSRFAKTSLFSTANQFTDLTLDPRYSAVCGYTDRELDEVFAPELGRFERDEIRRFYNGYSWSGWEEDEAERVYNPYDVLMLFGDPKGVFQDYWYETGAPQFLVETLTQRGLVEVAGLDGATASRAALLDFDVERIGTAALLFQTGYLTIRRTMQVLGRQHYELGYPNVEVRRSLNLMMLNALTGDEQHTEKLGMALLDALATGDPEKLRTALTTLYATMPHQQCQGGIDRIEGHYVQLLLAAAHMLGLRAVAEDSSARGRADLTLVAGDRVHVFEFKMQGAGDPLAQALERGYADKYAHFGDRAQVVGVVIDPTTRNVAELRTAQPFPKEGKEGRLDENQPADR